MSTYVFLDSEGFVQSSVESEWNQEAGVLIESDIGYPPEPGFSYHLATQTWSDVRSEKTKSRAAIRAALTKRASLLSSSDWTQLPDVSSEIQTSWRPYRQTLRDIPMQAGYPFTVNWPVAP